MQHRQAAGVRSRKTSRPQHGCVTDFFEELRALLKNSERRLLELTNAERLRVKAPGILMIFKDAAAKPAGRPGEVGSTFDGRASLSLIEKDQR